MSKTKNVSKGGKRENKVPGNGLDYEYFGNERSYNSAIDADGNIRQAVTLDSARRVGLVSLFAMQEVE